MGSSGNNKMCGSCGFWDGDRDGDYGNCGFLNKDNYSFLYGWPIVCGYGEYRADYFMTRRDFCCIYYRKIPND
jgi:hypothetical protein